MVQVLSNMAFQRSSFFSFKLKVREGEVVHLLCNSYVLCSISGPQISDYQDPTTDTHMRSCYSKSEMSWLSVIFFSGKYHSLENRHSEETSQMSIHYPILQVHIFLRHNFFFQVNISLYEYFASVFCLTETLFHV